MAMNFPQRSSAPGAPPASTVTAYFDTATFPRYKSQNPDGSINLYQVGLTNASVASVSAGYAADTYLAGSAITIPVAGDWRVGGQYHCGFDMVKTGAGTAAFTVNIRMGTLGTTGDASILSLAFAAGTAVADTGWFDLWAGFRTVGSGTSAVVQGMIGCYHHLAATGLITTGASGFGLILGTAAGFNSTTQTIVGISVNGGASFSGTNTLVQAQYLQP